MSILIFFKYMFI